MLLDAMARIIRDTSNWEDIDLTKELIHLASSEMTKSKVWNQLVYDLLGF